MDHATRTFPARIHAPIDPHPHGWSPHQPGPAHTADTATAGGPGWPAPLLLTVEEAARSLAIGRTRMFDLIRTGSVASVRIGNSRRIPISALHQYLSTLAPAEPQPASSADRPAHP